MKNRFGEKEKGQGGLIISVVIFVLILAVFLYGINDVSAKSESESIKQLNTAVRHAVVHCYAEEGQYPPNIAYLEEHYGLQYDHSKYIIDYQSFATNVMPEISVIRIGGS